MNALYFVATVLSAGGVTVLVHDLLSRAVWLAQRRTVSLNDMKPSRVRRALRIRAPRDCRGRYTHGRIV